MKHDSVGRMIPFAKPEISEWDGFKIRAKK